MPNCGSLFGKIKSHDLEFHIPWSQLLVNNFKGMRLKLNMLVTKLNMHSRLQSMQKAMVKPKHQTKLYEKSQEQLETKKELWAQELPNYTKI